MREDPDHKPIPHFMNYMVDVVKMYLTTTQTKHGETLQEELLGIRVPRLGVLSPSPSCSFA